MRDIIERIAEMVLLEMHGTIAESTGATLTALDFPAPLGGVAMIETTTGTFYAEVIGFRDGRTLLAPWDDAIATGIRPGMSIRLTRSRRYVGVGPELCGRTLNAHAEPMDDGPTLAPTFLCRPEGDVVPGPLDRPPIRTPLGTGVRAIDGLLTIGRGQRMAILAGSGVGKSRLLGTIARATDADIVVAALIGERSREVADFVQRDLAAARERSVVVVATSDEPAIRRVHAIETAFTVAESFRDSGKHVLLLVDSLTRAATAMREIGLAAGEPPAARGFPPSVFTRLPRLLERAGPTADGSITAICTVLVEADDPQDPIADAVRGILDGHIWLSRTLAERGHYPAIEIGRSVSRLMPELVTPLHRTAADRIRALIGVWTQHEDLISLGAYRRGGDPAIDAAIDAHEPIRRYLMQDLSVTGDFDAARHELLLLVRSLLAGEESGAKR